MAIHLQDFKPLEHKHYTLAKTQSEYDEDAKRQIAIDNNRAASQEAIATMREANQNNRTNAAINEQRNKDAVSQENLLAAEDRQLSLDQANLNQKAIDNNYRDRVFNASQENISADNARAQQSADRQFGLSEAADSRAQQKANQEAEDYRSMAPLKGQTLALAKIGSVLDNVDVDKDGAADATKYKEDLAKVWGFDPEKYQSITLQGNKESGRLEAFGFDGKKSVPITTPAGQPISVSHDAIYNATKIAGFGKGGQDKNLKDNYVDVKNKDEMGNEVSAKYNPETGETLTLDPKSGAVKRGVIGKPTMGDSVADNRSKDPGYLKIAEKYGKEKADRLYDEYLLQSSN